MAKGSSGGKRGGSSGALVVKSIQIGGVDIDLSSYPLVYGSDDPVLTAEAKKSIDAFETQRRGAKIEYSRFVDDQGNVIEDNRGGKGSVSASLHARNTAYAMSHNHPRDNGSGQLGGTFSTIALLSRGAEQINMDILIR